jgi:hypothetical protein
MYGENMDLKVFLEILRSLLVVGLFTWGAIQGLAQAKSAHSTKPTAQPPAGQVQRWQGGQRTITDAAGRPHVRHERITFAQRKAAAKQRVQAMRQAAAKKKQAEVKQ